MNYKIVAFENVQHNVCQMCLQLVDKICGWVTFNGRSGGNAGLSFGRPRRKSCDEIITDYNTVICIPDCNDEYSP